MKKALPILLAAMLLSGCGTAGQNITTSQSQEQVSDVEFSKLQQTVSEDIRNEKVEPQDDVDGMSPEVLQMQSQEGTIIMQVLDEVFGSYEEVEKHTVVYFQNEETDTHQVGLYIGMKENDESFKKLFDALQKKVDEGEILAKYIHFRPVAYTQQELNVATDETYTTLQSSNIGREGGNFGVSISPITNVVRIDHNMFADEDQQKVRELLKTWEVEFHQSGAMIPGPGEPLIIYPEEEFTSEPQSNGEIIMSLGDGQVNTQNVYYKFNEADQLSVGMRVDIEPSGPVLLSFPGQGSAAFVTVYPNYKPEGATLSEFEVNALAIDQLSEEQRNAHPLLESVLYDATANKWTVTFSLYMEDAEPFDILIEDK